MDTKKKTIAIAGAGFGGLSAARALGEYFAAEYRIGRDYKIALIDRHEYQLYAPALYEIATTDQTTASNIALESIITFPVEKAIADLPVQFLQKEIRKIDLKGKMIDFAGEGSLEFEYLVVACGVETNFYNIPGLQENSYPLKTFTDALKLRDAISLSLSDPNRTKINIVVGGGGATGVEFAGEMAVWMTKLENTYGKRGAGRIVLMEAAPEILAALDPQLMEKARTRLENLGVTVRTDAPIERVEAGQVRLATGEKIAFDILVWSGGTKTGPLIGTMDVKREAKGRLEVKNGMECIETSPNLDFGGKIYAIGDVTCLRDSRTGAVVPGIARAAIEEGKIAAYNIMADIMNTPKKEYVMAEYPYVITAGGKWATAKIGKFIISGLIGWIIKGLVELKYLLSVLPLPFALKTWFKGMWIFARND